MQRRAATVYAVLFLVVAAGAYSLIGVAQEPRIDVRGQTYAENDTVTVNGLQYTVASVEGSQGTLTRVNESSVYTAEWANNSTVQLANNRTYRVLIPNTSDPEQFTLRQQFNLSDDVSTTTQGGTTYVVVNETGGNKSLVPVEEYKRQQFGRPDTRQYAEGDTFQFEGNRTTVTNVTKSAATLQWTAPRTLETSLSEGGVVTLGPNNETFVAHFPEQGVVQLSPNPDAYREDVEAINHFHERIAGLWGVAIMSALVVALLVGLAFLPNK